jgi:hypothetical protein
MSMIFPGMDPYLEDPQLWPGVHTRMIVYLADALQRLLGRRYIAAVEERVYLEGPDREVIPDVWLRRASVESATRPHSTTQPAMAVLEECELYPARLRYKLPRVLIPLAGDDPDVPLEIQAVLNQTYDAGDYRDRIDYHKPCMPPLSADDQTWADQLIHHAGATTTE